MCGDRENNWCAMEALVVVHRGVERRGNDSGGTTAGARRANDGGGVTAR